MLPDTGEPLGMPKVTLGRPELRRTCTRVTSRGLRVDRPVRVLKISDFDIARFEAAMESGNLTPRDVGYRILNPAPPWEAEVRFYGTLRQVPWNVLYF
jgi:hypothetical protein